MSNKTPEELAQDASAPGTFSFVERLRGRAYPHDTTKISLNEELGYKIMALEEDLSKETDAKKVKALEAQLAELQEQVKPDVYTLHMRGLSPEESDLLIDRVLEQYPYEYEETSNPFTGEVNKRPIPSEERDRLHRQLVWTASIEKIEDHEGNIAEVNEAVIDDFMKHAPLMAQREVLQMVEKLKMATDWMQYIQDEDFLVKP